MVLVVKSRLLTTDTILEISLVAITTDVTPYVHHHKTIVTKGDVFKEDYSLVVS